LLLKSRTLRSVSGCVISSAKKAIAALWPDGIPEDFTNPQIEQRVAEQMKKMGAPAISRDTILRAAGRK
jgi:hypothetical protein